MNQKGQDATERIPGENRAGIDFKKLERQRMLQQAERVTWTGETDPIEAMQDWGRGNGKQSAQKTEQERIVQERVDQIQQWFDGLKSKKEESMASTRKQAEFVKLGNPTAAQNEENRPKCRVHRRFMNYNPAEDQMECPEDGCKQVAKKPRTFRNAIGSDVEGRPVVYRGGLEFVTDAEGGLYLHLVEQNAMVSLEGIDQAKPFANSAEASTRAVNFMRTIATFLPSATIASEAAKRRRDKDAELEQIDARLERKREQLQQQQRIDAMKLNGVPLPPHIKDVTQVNEIQRRVNILHKADATKGVSKTSAEYIAAALAYMADEVDDDGDLNLVFFTTQGREVDSGLMLRSEWEDKPIAVMQTLNDTLSVLDRSNPAEAPHYGMFGGRPYTKRLVQRALSEAR